MGTHEKGTDVGVFYNKCTFVIVDEYRNKVVNAVMFLGSLNWGGVDSLCSGEEE